jgi:hypothetical protein
MYYLPSNYLEPIFQWHGVISKYNGIFIYTLVKTSPLAQKILSREEWEERDTCVAAGTETLQTQPLNRLSGLGRFEK